MLGSICKWKVLCGVFFTFLPIYSWYRFFKLRKKLEQDLKSKQLFYERHNCVVMFANNRAPTGWPNPDKSKPGNDFVRTGVYDSMLYFIRTANKSIDVAMMLIDTKVLVDALIEAHKRNVVIRVLVDYDYSKNSKARDLQNAGIQVMYYVCPESEISSILHYKYMLKDYHNGEGFVYFGSLNWSNSGIKQNYENTVFTSHPSVAKAFHESFEEAWNFVSDMYKTNYYVKAILKGVQ